MRVQRLYFSQGLTVTRTIPKIKPLQNAIINLYKRIRTFHAYTPLFSPLLRKPLYRMCYLTKIRFSYLLSQDMLTYTRKRKENNIKTHYNHPIISSQIELHSKLHCNVQTGDLVRTRRMLFF